MGGVYSTVLPRNGAVFQCKMSKFSANVPTGIGSNPYLNVDFDQYRSFFTDRNAQQDTLHPRWDNEVRFNYETAYLDCLHVKKCIIMAFGIKDTEYSFIGQSSIDLHTLACGPPNVTLTLMAGDRPVGYVSFQIEMNQMAESKVMLRNGTLTPLNSFAQKPTQWKLRYSLRSYLSSGGIVGTRETPCVLSSQPMPLLPGGGLYSGGTLVDILQDALYLDLVGKDGVSYGHAAPMFNIQTNNPSIGTDEVVVNISVDLCHEGGHGGQGSPMATFTGDVVITGLPRFAQMVEGSTLDGVLQYGAKPLFDYLPKPRKIQSAEEASAARGALPAASLTEPIAPPSATSPGYPLEAAYSSPYAAWQGPTNPGPMNPITGTFPDSQEMYGGAQGQGQAYMLGYPNTNYKVGYA